MHSLMYCVSIALSELRSRQPAASGPGSALRLGQRSQSQHGLGARSWTVMDSMLVFASGSIFVVESSSTPA